MITFFILLTISAFLVGIKSIPMNKKRKTLQEFSYVIGWCLFSWNMFISTRIFNQLSESDSFKFFIAIIFYLLFIAIIHWLLKSFLVVLLKSDDTYHTYP